MFIIKKNYYITQKLYTVIRVNVSGTGRPNVSCCAATATSRMTNIGVVTAGTIQAVGNSNCPQSKASQGRFCQRKCILIATKSPRKCAFWEKVVGCCIFLFVIKGRQISVAVNTSRHFWCAHHFATWHSWRA